MSRENVEIARRILEAHTSEDVEGAIDTAIALSDPNIEVTSVLAVVEPMTYRGHDGIRDYFAEMLQSWDRWEMDVEETIEVGPDTVLAAFRSRLVGRESGVTVEARRASVVAFSNGKVVRVTTFISREEALEAVGLAE
jgi:ketosteroid isomerase-like protein